MSQDKPRTAIMFSDPIPDHFLVGRRVHFRMLSGEKICGTIAERSDERHAIWLVDTSDYDCGIADCYCRIPIFARIEHERRIPKARKKREPKSKDPKVDERQLKIPGVE